MSGRDVDSRPYDYEADRRTTVIARMVTRIVVPFMLVTAVALLLQGHNLPGGGFIGGVLTVAAFVLIYVIFGLDYVQTEVLRLSPDESGHSPIETYRWLFGGGLALAVLSGLVPILFGYEFLTQGVWFFKHVPLYEEFEVASALFFDFGVFFTVVGALLTVAAEVGRE
ncbi:multicomponent Na+:H+ antiporter subunit B [Halogeometricum rufum]|uniref:Multicomponent Na+:H+ antiporter subunit B n=1 Tax=Halogeometricum rufum TaxID=553469 RepID=A0A1I6GKS8_9EURY|nr:MULTISPECIES: MnhB domain-containing protein [Halogeometricum]MUV56934.1 sodium:proton antiporter [Halogeometricum sp. CBA1124]SFR42751.1 multicomponent Na+:H+ antiporter subunit B [Halogeometricum rufum]